MDNLWIGDVLIEILLWLPVKSLFAFKVVSKMWCDTISSPYFKELYLSRRRTDDPLSSLLGFLQLGSSAFVPCTTASSNINNGADHFVLDGDSFMGCSSGLLLYYNCYSMDYRVWNPVKKQSLHLPQPEFSHSNVAIGFDSEEIYDDDDGWKLKDFKFKLVCLVFENISHTHALWMEIFSSETWSWRRAALRMSSALAFLRPAECAVVIDGVYYWLDCSRRVLAYNLSSSQGWGQEEVGLLIPLPPKDIDMLERSCILGKSTDGLLQFGRSDTFKFEVWILQAYTSVWGSPEPEWFHSHTINFLNMNRQYPDIMNSVDIFPSLKSVKDERKANVPLLLRFCKSDSRILFVQLNETIMSYRLYDGKLEQVVQFQTDHFMSRQQKLEHWHPGERNNKLVPYYLPKWAFFHL